MSDSELAAALRALADAEAIRDLARRYAHHVWRKEIAAAIDLFTEDGEMDTGDAPPIRGRAALLAAYARMLGEAEFLPFVHNHVIEVRGDGATGTCYLDLRASVGGRSMIGAGWYDDRYVRVEGGWRFRSRKLNLHHFAPLREGWAETRGG